MARSRPRARSSGCVRHRGPGGCECLRLGQKRNELVTIAGDVLAEGTLCQHMRGGKGCVGDICRTTQDQGGLGDGCAETEVCRGLIQSEPSVDDDA